MAKKTRKIRDTETSHPTREEESRADVWIPPGLLDAPAPRPGMRQRWVSTQILGNDVPQHTMRRFREGWQPRPVDTVSDDFYVPSIEHGKYEGCVGVEGMILCEMPEERAQMREAYFKSKTRDQTNYVNVQLGRVGRAGGIPINDEGDRGIRGGPGVTRVAADD